FATDAWEPPTDYSRANGLVEEIRQAQFEYAELKRLEEESRPTDERTHEPSDPIALPVEVHQTQQPRQSAPKKAAPKKKAPAKRPKKSDNQFNNPIRIAPIARSVNLERVE